jgi:hypothetical protein
LQNTSNFFPASCSPNSLRSDVKNSSIEAKILSPQIL